MSPVTVVVTTDSVPTPRVSTSVDRAVSAATAVRAAPVAPVPIAIHFGGVVYVGSGDRNIYALNASSGALLWSYTTGGEVFSSPAVANGVVYVGSGDRKVYGLSVGSGALLWSSTTGGVVGPSSPAVANGVVYVGSEDHKLYAFGLPPVLHVVERMGPGAVLPSGQSGSSTATCNSGEVAVGGGSVAVRSSDGSVEQAFTTTQSEATPEGATSPTKWTVSGTNNDTVDANFGARILCATADSATVHVAGRGDPATVLDHGVSGTSTATCQSGELATGGGYSAVSNYDSSMIHAFSTPLNEATPDGATSPTAWTAAGTNNDTTARFGARILCTRLSLN